MSGLFAALLATIPNAFLAVLGRLVTEKFMIQIVTKVTVYSLEWAASRTSNTIDDELVKDVTARLESGAG